MKTLLTIIALCIVSSAQDIKTVITGNTFSSGALVVVDTPAEEKEDVQALTAAEIKQLADAKKKLDEAQKMYDDIESSIKAAHGQYISRRACSGSSTIVAFFGNYALITTKPIPSCIVAD